MPRFTSYVPHGVIPAVILPFHDDLSIDETRRSKRACEAPHPGRKVQ